SFSVFGPTCQNTPESFFLLCCGSAGRVRSGEEGNRVSFLCAPRRAAPHRRARCRATPPAKLRRAPPRRHRSRAGIPYPPRTARRRLPVSGRRGLSSSARRRDLAGVASQAGHANRDSCTQAVEAAYRESKSQARRPHISLDWLASSLRSDMISSSLFSRPRLAPRPASAAASPCRARLAVGSGGARGLAAGVRCQAQAGDMDAHYMRRCVKLAWTAAGHTSPNPMVGCVIVSEGQVVGEGFHPKAGQPHAEVFALRDAGHLAENATAYVSLEPCNHYGRTPPCTEALIKAKVKEVVVGMTDPNPIVASKGIEKLRNAGIDVRVGVEEALCLRLNEAYIHRMLTGKAFATLRTTLSMNGTVINQIGSGADQPGGYYSQLAKEYDGVIISSDMAKATTLPISCEAGAKQPLYIIIAQGEGSKVHIPFLNEESASNAIVLADSPVAVEPSGVSVSVLDQMNLESILRLLADRGLCSVLVDFRDAGGVLVPLLSKFQEDKLVQKVVVELSPVWVVSPGPSDLAFGGSQSFPLKNVEHKEVNGTLLLEGYL
ncbi:riboflavin biosynthesis protein PYRD, chloroplastic, partial [Triticum aestivum]